MFASNPCQFDQQCLPARLELLGASLSEFVKFDRASLDGIEQTMLPFFGLLKLAIELVDPFLLGMPLSPSALTVRAETTASA